MSDPRREFLDVLERALQHVPHFTTPTTVPSDMSWGTFFDSSELLAAWLALDDEDRAESVITAITGYVNRVNAMASEGKELCARVAMHFGDEKRAAGLYGVASAAMTGGTLPALRLVPESNEDGGDGDEELGAANESPGAGVELPDGEAFDIGAALRARYPGIPAIDHVALDDAVELLQEAARAVATGLDLDALLQIAAELDEPEGDSAEADSAEADHSEARAGSAPGHHTPELTAGLVQAAETAREAADLLHGAATRLDAYSRMAGATAGLETEPGDSSPSEDLRYQLRDHLAPAPDFDDPAEAILLALQARYAEFRDVDNDTFVAMLRDLQSLWDMPDPGPGFESDVEGETAARTGTCAEPRSGTSRHVSDLEVETEPDAATSSRPIIVIDATWSESEPTAGSRNRCTASARSANAQPPAGVSADIGRYVPRWQLQLAAVAAATMAVVAVVPWVCGHSGPALVAPSRPQGGKPSTVTVEPSITPPAPEEHEHLVPLAPGALATGNEGTGAVVNSEPPPRALIGEMNHPDEPVSERIVENKPGEAVASDRQRSKPLRIPARSHDSGRYPVAEMPHRQVPALAAAADVAPVLGRMKLQVPMGATVAIDQGDDATPLTLSVRRAPDDEYFVERRSIIPDDVVRLPRTTEHHWIEQHAPRLPDRVRLPGGR